MKFTRIITTFLSLSFLTACTLINERGTHVDKEQFLEEAEKIDSTKSYSKCSVEWEYSVTMDGESMSEHNTVRYESDGGSSWSVVEGDEGKIPTSSYVYYNVGMRFDASSLASVIESYSGDGYKLSLFVNPLKATISYTSGGGDSEGSSSEIHNTDTIKFDKYGYVTFLEEVSTRDKDSLHTLVKFSYSDW